MSESHLLVRLLEYFNSGKPVDAGVLPFLLQHPIPALILCPIEGGVGVGNQVGDRILV